MASKSIKQRPNGKYRARYRDLAGKEHARHFKLKKDAERWLDEVTAALVTGDYVDPKARKITVNEWCDLWIESYAKRDSTVRQAKVHLAQIRAEFGPLPLMAVDEMAVKRWMARLFREEVTQSYRFALHGRLSQIMRAAVRAKKITSNPCSRETSPGAGKQRAYVATEAQLWQMYELAAEKYRPAILLGAFAGLRVAEVCGLRSGDVDLDARVINPAVQYPAEPLKTDMSMTAVPIPTRSSRSSRGCSTGARTGGSSSTTAAPRWGRGRSSGRCAGSARRSTACRTSSVSTTSGTSSPRC
jgi:hypothetical protein